jgi:RHH-type transcriptional regulator, rel operon repressor / antitoxin RelB
MLSVRLPLRLQARLNRLAKRTGRTKAYYAKKAIEEFLEDQEDYFIALARLEEKLPGIPLDEVVKKLGLES